MLTNFEWKEIVIYGNGNFGVKMKEFIDRWGIENVSACLVTRSSDARGSFMGLPVASMRELETSDRQSAYTDCDSGRTSEGVD